MSARKCIKTSKRTGKRCNANAMAGSDFCYHHGGKSLKGADHPGFKHGRYSKHAKNILADKIEIFNDANPLDLLEELQTQRALLASFMDNQDDAILLAPKMVDLMMGWLEQIGRQVERIERIRNNSALTAAEVMFLQARLVDVVRKYIDEPADQEQFIREVFAGLDRPGSRNPQLVEAGDSETA